MERPFQRNILKMDVDGLTNRPSTSFKESVEKQPISSNDGRALGQAKLRDKKRKLQVYKETRKQFR
jgi:hypothetical protein